MSKKNWKENSIISENLLILIFHDESIVNIYYIELLAYIDCSFWPPHSLIKYITKRIMMRI